MNSQVPLASQLWYQQRRRMRRISRRQVMMRSLEDDRNEWDGAPKRAGERKKDGGFFFHLLYNMYLRTTATAIAGARANYCRLSLNIAFESSKNSCTSYSARMPAIAAQDVRTNPRAQKQRNQKTQVRCMSIHSGKDTNTTECRIT
jgi:hypothetical protein